MSVSVEHLRENIKAWKLLLNFVSCGCTIADGLQVIEKEFSTSVRPKRFEELVILVDQNKPSPPSDAWLRQFFSETECHSFALGWAIGFLEMTLVPASECVAALITQKEEPGLSTKTLFGFLFFKMLPAGLPILSLFKILKADFPDPSYHPLLDDCAAQVSQGLALAPVLQRNTILLPDHFAEAFEALEKSGDDQVMKDHLKLPQYAKLQQLVDSEISSKPQSKEKAKFYQAVAEKLTQEPNLQLALAYGLSVLQESEFKKVWTQLAAELDAVGGIEALQDTSLSDREKLMIRTGLRAGTLDEAMRKLVTLC